METIFAAVLFIAMLPIIPVALFVVIGGLGAKG